MTTTTPIERIAPRGGASPVRSLRITVLAGGPSVEREVSIDSGRAVGEALRRLGHDVQVRDIGPDDLSALDRRADFVFIALHGAFGEDGAVQALLDERRIPYSGTGASGSRRAMDKVVTKEAFAAAGIPTPPYVVATADSLDEIAERFGPPAVVKPVASGSSVDTSIARSPEALDRAARGVVGKYGSALVERFIDGMEWTVGVVDGAALPVCEIRPAKEFYDYDAKYADDQTQYVFDIDAAADLLMAVQAMSVRAHHALDCKAFSRVDWMIDRATLDPFALEINTIPGFTSHSLLPKAAARAGMTFDRLCQRIVDLSIGDVERRG